ncbi:hypothetical protein [Roseateles saccharophilus]|uniref:Uncharacterized protein n=1 Tax=Roseateles saccharophilus TaxID=304 RepID=A0A4R3UKZ5_ROSSA|nr:hypothetical protein [Roseateles saccharophilus]MDG0834171.1 hypothetical protein [Roseateles saccharophilus]TCU91307.1 hypothetical protein EV671_102623 [Roseateles saccharophilus]
MLEIAGGIVLAVILLWALPLLLATGAGIALLCIALIVIVLAVLHWQTLLGFVAMFIGCFAVVGLVDFGVRRIWKRFKR